MIIPRCKRYKECRDSLGHNPESPMYIPVDRRGKYGFRHTDEFGYIPALCVSCHEHDPTEDISSKAELEPDTELDLLEMIDTLENSLKSSILSKQELKQLKEQVNYLLKKMGKETK